jgi:hypothetical protein
MVTYYELGPHKRLNEIVVAGSHDAGITSGGGNIKTQVRNIGEQAGVGIRVFDLRIAAASAPGAHGGDKLAELRAFHADGKLMKNETKNRFLEDVGRTVDIKRTKLRGGAFGLALTEMLEQARDFVRSDVGKNEFLILKFDKCLNWGMIAEACMYVLGDDAMGVGTIYKGGGNLNTKTLEALKGKVIVLFSEKGVAELGGRYGPADGILKFRNLYSGGAYTKRYDGLQYYGKGGTSVSKPFKKRGQNESKQADILEGAKQMGDENMMGMMYWTTTGMFESIKKRDANMWSAPNIVKLQTLWAGGLDDYVTYANPFLVPRGSPALGPMRKRFMPNIVIIDFADDDKCTTIRGLNDLSPHSLAQLGA